MVRMYSISLQKSVDFCLNYLATKKKDSEHLTTQHGKTVFPTKLEWGLELPVVTCHVCGRHGLTEAWVDKEEMRYVCDKCDPDD